MSAHLQNVPSPVSEALILVCEKCGKKLTKEGQENPSRLIQQELKARIKDMDGKGKWRAVISSCMDVCPKDEITIGVSYAQASQGDAFFTTTSTDPKEVTEAVVEKIIRRR